MGYKKIPNKKYRLNFDWQTLDQWENNQEVPNMNPYYDTYNKWIKSNGIEDNEEHQEIFRKCYSLHKGKQHIQEQINECYWQLGLLQGTIDKNTGQILEIQSKLAKYNKLLKMTIKPTNYEKFHMILNSQDIKPIKQLHRIKKTKEFIFGYLLKDDELFNKIALARKLQGKG